MRWFYAVIAAIFTAIACSDRVLAATTTITQPGTSSLNQTDLNEELADSDNTKRLRRTRSELEEGAKDSKADKATGDADEEEDRELIADKLRYQFHTYIDKIKELILAKLHTLTPTKVIDIFRLRELQRRQ